MNGQRFHQQKRTETKTEQCERSLNGNARLLFRSRVEPDYSVRRPDDMLGRALGSFEYKGTADLERKIYSTMKDI